MGEELDRTIRELSAPGKGILAADESSNTIAKRFQSVGVQSTPETRRAYRELLFTAPGIEEFISGVILYEETLMQGDESGKAFPQLLAQRGIVPGIKVDQGLAPLPRFADEKYTQGLDALASRLQNYKNAGARFAKWRAVFTVSPGPSTRQAIEANALALALYAGICQEQGIVPIVEPEVLMDGDHTIDACATVTQEVQQLVFHALAECRVRFEHMLLKPNMVISGSTCPEQATPEQIATATLTCLRRTVPAAVPGIFFLSGGQSEQAAAANLNAIAVQGKNDPWVLSFSYSRALQSSAMKIWKGNPANRAEAQNAFLERARLVSAAREGRYSEAMEK